MVSRRCLQSGAFNAFAAGHRSLPQVGAITMDQLVLDATDHPRLEAGERRHTCLGMEAGERDRPQAWAELAHSIPWEVLCGFKHRLPRLPQRGLIAFG